MGSRVMAVTTAVTACDRPWTSTALRAPLHTMAHDKSHHAAQNLPYSLVQSRVLKAHALPSRECKGEVGGSDGMTRTRTQPDRPDQICDDCRSGDLCAKDDVDSCASTICICWAWPIRDVQSLIFTSRVVIVDLEESGQLDLVGKLYSHYFSGVA